MARFVTERDAAEALGLPLSNFRHWVKIGRLPGLVADVQLYDLKALHAACDRFSGLGSPRDALDAWEQKQGLKDGLGTIERRSHR